MKKTAMISGAGVAGQVAAYWLDRAGWDCVIVERAHGLRTGGQNVDIRGSAREVITRMGMAEAVAGHGTGEVGTRFVDEGDRSLAAFAEDGSAGGGGTAEWEILRGQLTTLLADATTGARYLFGTSITRVEDEDPARVRVTLDDDTVHDVDVLIIAEGIGSRTRELLTPRFGSVERRSLGVAIGYFSIPRAPGDDQWWRWYNAPGGRAVTLRPDNVGRERATLSFRTPPIGSLTDDPKHAARLLESTFRGAGWETDRILDALPSVDDLYVDDIGQIRAARWTSGRIALVGDAAYSPSPVTGMGTSLAISGAYVLAAEITRSPADIPAALRQYDNTLRPFVKEIQRLPLGAPGVMHPRTRIGVTLLQFALRLAGSGILRPFERILFHPPADRLRLPPTPPTNRT